MTTLVCTCGHIWIWHDTGCVACGCASYQPSDGEG